MVAAACREKASSIFDFSFLPQRVSCFSAPLTNFSFPHARNGVPNSTFEDCPSCLLWYTHTLSLSLVFSSFLFFFLYKLCFIWCLGVGQTGCLNMERHGSSEGSTTGSPPIALGLALGLDGSSDHRPTPIPGCSKPYGFTILQLHELQLQSLIYKYLESGFPVPYHLLLPIWKSVSSSLNSVNDSSLYQLYPSCKSPLLYMQFFK